MGSPEDGQAGGRVPVEPVQRGGAEPPQEFLQVLALELHPGGHARLHRTWGHLGAPELHLGTPVKQLCHTWAHTDNVCITPEHTRAPVSHLGTPVLHLYYIWAHL